MKATPAAVALIAVALWGGGQPGVSWAQEPPRPAALAPERPGPSVRLDVFVGGAAFERYEQPDFENTDADIRYATTGWQAGATAFVGVPWLGITGAVGCQTIETTPAYHAAIGPQFMSPWIIGEDVGFRLFAHALYGVVSTAGDSPTQRGTEWVFGGGIDVLLLRIQYDYVRLNLPALARGNNRIFVGGVVPLCLRSCRDGEINLSGRPAIR